MSPDLSPYSIHYFLERSQIKNERGDVLDFKDHGFLWDVYLDKSPRLVCLKAAQIGFTTMAILKTAHLARYTGLDIIYILPTASDVNDFVSGKVNRIIAQNPVLQEWTKDKDSVEQKQMGNNIIYYRGSWTERAALMVSADLLVMDEFDRSKQDILDQYSSRLQHSKHGWQWVFSNPSAMGHGVDKYWQLSDQKHWFIKCQACKHEQYLRWPESIDQERKCFQCLKCHAELTREARAAGSWRPKFDRSEERPWSGYWISLLMAPWVSAAYILDLYESKTEEYFYNFVLGLPWVGSGNKITEEMLWQNLKKGTHLQDGRIVIGCDTGKHLHYVCGDSKGLFFHGETDTYDDLERLLERWPTSVIVFDQGGDLIGPRKLREKYPGRVYLCHYAVDRKTMQLIRWGKDQESGNVIADRNRMIQLVIDELNDKRLPIWGTIEDWWPLWIHCANIYRVQEENALGVIERRWERSGPDHLLHALVYWRVGMDKFGLGNDATVMDDGPKTRYRLGPEIEPNETVRYDPKLMMPDADQDF